MDKPMDKVVLITGASSGIGEATALHLAERGCTVVGARWVDRLRSLVERVEFRGGEAHAHPRDRLRLGLRPSRTMAG